MANNSDPAIEALLQQRAQFEQWLARLDSTTDKAPQAVRAKVRGDYEARLRGVIDELRTHSATISQELERHRATQSGLNHEKSTVEEELAEAEVRHAVGEYTDEEWQRLSDRANERLGRLRGELGGVGNEIARLAEVQGLISGTTKKPEPPAPAPRPPEPTPVAAAPEPAPEPPPPPPPAPEPVVASSRPAPKAQPRETEDEMAFLKSVAPAEEERKPAPQPPSRRASNPGSGGSGRSEAAATQTAAPGKPGAAGGAKTLKCGECGTLNRPTEWYCERCGAELAGV
jgi:hypothetical protein